MTTRSNVPLRVLACPSSRESDMIHIMVTATVRDLRTRFPRIKELIAREGEIIVTDRGRQAYLLRSYVPRRSTRGAKIDYFARLKARQPRPLSPETSRAIDQLNRGER